MGGGIPTRWLWYNRDRRLSFQIACSSLSNLVKQSSFLDTCPKKHKRAMGFKAILRPPFYTLITVGKVLLRSEHDALGGRGRSEDVQRTLGGAQRTLRSAHWTLRGIQRTLRDAQRTLRGSRGDAQRPLGARRRRRPPPPPAPAAAA